MSNVLIGFLIACGAAGWVYSKLARTTGGGRVQDTLVVAGVTLVIVWAVIAFALSQVTS